MAPADAAGGAIPDMKLCDSSLLHSWAYDAESKTLWLRMQHERRLYRYDAVPDNIVADMEKAPSIGSYITRNVIRQYKGVRIEEKE